MSKASLAVAYAVRRRSKGGQTEATPMLDTQADEPNELLGADSDQLRTGDEDFLTNEDAPSPDDGIGNELGDADQTQARSSVLQKIMSRRR